MSERSAATDQQAVQDAAPTYRTVPPVITTDDVPTGYKRTEMGVIPEDWSVKTVTELGQIITGGTPPTKVFAYWGDEYPWVTPSDISERKDIYATERHITAAGLRAIRSLPPKSVLVTCIASIGKNAVLKVAGGCNQQINAVIPDKANDANFLYYLFEFYKSYLVGKAGTTATSIISKGIFSGLQFAIARKEEQRAIATALSDADALIESLDRLIAKKRAIKQAAMQQLLTGENRLPGFEGEWESRRLDEVGWTYGGLTGKTGRDFGHGSGRYVTFLNVVENTVVQPSQVEAVAMTRGEKQNCVHAGDLLFNGSSETPDEVGLCALVDRNPGLTYLNSFCFGFRLKESAASDGLYLAYYFRSQEGRELMKVLAQGSTRFNLSKKAFLATSVRLPEKREQEAIAAALWDMDVEIEALERRRDKAGHIKQGMMQELLTGRTRLVESGSEDDNEAPV